LNGGRLLLGAARYIPEKYHVVQGDVRDRTTAQQRAIVSLVFYLVLTVVFSYIVAETIYVVVQVAEIDPTAEARLGGIRAQNGRIPMSGGPRQVRRGLPDG
jgi:hypothetical protein